MRLSLIASVAAVTVVATTAHAQYAAPAAPTQGLVPEVSRQVLEKVYHYSLAPGANSTLMSPPAGVPVMVMGIQSDSGFRGVGQVVLYRVKGAFLEWTGLESPANSAITDGYDSAVGRHIVWLDYGHTVDIQVSGSDTFYVHNASAYQADGKVTLVW